MEFNNKNDIVIDFYKNHECFKENEMYCFLYITLEGRINT